MKYSLIAFIFFQFCFSLLGQERNNCDWIEQLKKSTSIEDQLGLIQENFHSCILIVANGRPVSSDSSQYYYVRVEPFIKSMKHEEIGSIYLLNKKASLTLYGPHFQNVAIITFNSDEVMSKMKKRIDNYPRKHN